MNADIFAPFAVCVVGGLTIIVLLAKNKSLPARLLALFLFSITYTIFLMFLFNSGYILTVPLFFRTAPFFAYLIAPSFYLYLSFSLDRTRRLQWKHSLHLLAALLYVLDYFPLLTSSVESKKEILQNLVNHRELILNYREGWIFPDGFTYNAWVFYSLFYIPPAVAMLVRYYRSGLSISITRNNMFPWMITFTSIYSLYTIICALALLLSSVSALWFIHVTNAAIMVTIVSIALFFRPHILYDGFYIVRGMDTEEKQTKQSQLKIPDNTLAQIELQMRSYFDQNLFLRKNLTLKDVAAELEIQPYLLSAYINQTYNMHFNDLINRYRIDHIKQELLGKGRDMLTLEAIAEKAGYNNRTTFLSAFKKFTGMTPTAFIKHSKNLAVADDQENKRNA